MLSWTLRQLRSQNSSKRLQAAVKLGHSGNRNAIEPLIVAKLKDSDGSVRAAAAKALESIDPNWKHSEHAKTYAPSLVAALKDSNDSIREAAAGLLSEVCDKRAIRELVLVLANDHSFARETAARLLEKIDPNWRQSEDCKGAVLTMTILTEIYIRDQNYYGLILLARALGEIGNKQAIEKLENVLKTRDDKVRIAVVGALEMIDTPESKRLLQEYAECGSQIITDEKGAVRVDREGTAQADALGEPVRRVKSFGEMRSFNTFKADFNCRVCNRSYGQISIDVLRFVTTNKLVGCFCPSCSSMICKECQLQEVDAYIKQEGITHCEFPGSTLPVEEAMWVLKECCLRCARIMKEVGTS